MWGGPWPGGPWQEAQKWARIYVRVWVYLKCVYICLCVYLYCLLLLFYSLNRFHLFCDPMDYSPPGSSVHRIIPVRILECITISFFRGFSLLRDWTCVSCIGRQILYHWATKGSPVYLYTCVHVCCMFCVWNIVAQWGIGLNAKCPKKAGSPGSVFIFFFSLKASIGLGKQGNELRKSGSRAGWDPLLPMDIAAPGQTQQVCQRVHPGMLPKNSHLLGSRNVRERFLGTFSLHMREGVL